MLKNFKLLLCIDLFWGDHQNSSQKICIDICENFRIFLDALAFTFSPHTRRIFAYATASGSIDFSRFACIKVLITSNHFSENAYEAKKMMWFKNKFFFFNLTIKVYFNTRQKNIRITGK